MFIKLTTCSGPSVVSVMVCGSDVNVHGLRQGHSVKSYNLDGLQWIWTHWDPVC